jgi:hypothetical protein
MGVKIIVPNLSKNAYLLPLFGINLWLPVSLFFVQSEFGIL